MTCVIKAGSWRVFLTAHCVKMVAGHNNLGGAGHLDKPGRRAHPSAGAELGKWKRKAKQTQQPGGPSLLNLWPGRPALPSPILFNVAFHFKIG